MNEGVSLDNFVEKVDNLMSQIDAFHGDRLYLELFSKIASSLDYLENPHIKKIFSLGMTKGKIGDKYGVKFLETYFLNGLGFYILDDESRKGNPIYVLRFRFFNFDIYQITDKKNNKDSLFGLKEIK